MKIITEAARYLKNKYVMVSAPAIIVNVRGEILLGKRSRKAIFYQGFWGLPGGVTWYGERLIDAVTREVREELGVSCNVTKVSKKYYEFFPTKACPLHNVNIPHYCKLKGKPTPKDETSEVKWFSKKEIKKMKLAYIHKEILRGEGLI